MNNCQSDSTECPFEECPFEECPFKEWPFEFQAALLKLCLTPILSDVNCFRH